MGADHSKLRRDGTPFLVASRPAKEYITITNKIGRAMLTVREVEAAVAEMLKASPTAAAHYIRTLKEAEPSLWFRVGRGRTEAPLHPSHLVSVVLAFVGGQPVEAPSTVALFRSLRLEDIRRPKTGQDYYGGTIQAPVEMCGLTIYPTLGETLDSLAKAGSGQAGPPRFFFVDVYPEGSVVEARITVIEETDRYVARFTSIGILTEAEMREREPEGQTSMISRTVTLWPPLFERMAELLRASALSPAKIQSSGPVSSVSARPEDENAALSEAALPTQDQASIPDGNTPEAMRGSGNAQALSSRGPGLPTSTKDQTSDRKAHPASRPPP